MSTIYNLEPQPTASAILHTTLGEIHVELFAKQAPLTCRNFLQHCLDGYYDGTIFHRLVPNFILQGGDPTGTGHGGEAIYDGGAFGGDLDAWPLDQRRGANAGPDGVNFRDEFHSRLKINRRGLLAMANEGRPDTNGSQFFFTLDKAEELNGKNTMFGRVAGDTIYNLAKIGESEIDEATERPLYPVRIERVEILVNPFDDMKERSRIAPVMVRPRADKSKDKDRDKDKKAKRKKAGKQLLSFGDEEGEDTAPVLKKAKFDTRIVMMEEEAEEVVVVETKAAPLVDKSFKPVKTYQDEARKQASKSSSNQQRREGDISTSQRSLGLETPKETTKPGKRQERTLLEASPEPESERGREREREREQGREREGGPGPKPVPKTALERANEELAALKASMRRTIHAEKPMEEKKKSVLEAMIPETSTRGRKRRPGGTNTTASEDQAALSLLKAFQARLDQAPPGSKDNIGLGTDDLGGNHDGDGGGDGDGDDDVDDDTHGGYSSRKGGQGRQDKDKRAQDEEETELCDLHFIAGCQSCTAWDKQAKEESDDEGWMSHALSFAADRLGKDLSNRKKAEEELVVIDPREKARTLKDEKRAGREARAGGAGRAWDQARDQVRNAQMARAASLAGRGAR